MFVYAYKSALYNNNNALAYTIHSIEKKKTKQPIHKPKKNIIFWGTKTAQRVNQEGEFSFSIFPSDNSWVFWSNAGICDVLPWTWRESKKEKNNTRTNQQNVGSDMGNM